MRSTVIMTIGAGHILVDWCTVECWHTVMLALGPIEVTRSMVVLGDTKGSFNVNRKFAVLGAVVT